MIITETEITISEPSLESIDEVHYVCMGKDYPFLALCGINLEGHEHRPDSEITCVVCEDLIRIDDFCPHHIKCFC